jgi:hypothetical protein
MTSRSARAVPTQAEPRHTASLIRCIRRPATAASFGGGWVVRFGWTKLGLPCIVAMSEPHRGASSPIPTSRSGDSW